MTPWKMKKTEIILDTKFFKVRKDRVVLPEGKEIDWIYWDSQDSAMIIGMTAEKKLVMIKQYRYIVGGDVIEFPSGGLEENEDAEAAAKREFEEETGYFCNDLVKLGSFYETYGHLNRKIHIFFAKNVAKSNRAFEAKDDEFEKTKVEMIDFDSAIKLSLENKIVAMGSSLAVLLLKQKIEANEISFK